MLNLSHIQAQVNNTVSGGVSPSFESWEAIGSPEHAGHYAKCLTCGQIYAAHTPGDLAAAITAHHCRDEAAAAAAAKNTVQRNLAVGRFNLAAAMMKRHAGAERDRWAALLREQVAILAADPAFDIARDARDLHPQVAADLAARIAAATPALTLQLTLTPDPEPQPQPEHPAHQVAADLLAVIATRKLPAAQIKKLESRLENAVALVIAGQIEFPNYQTKVEPFGLYGKRSCNCADARFRGVYLNPVGLACKHTLAQYLQEQIEAETGRVAHRHLVDQLDRHSLRQTQAAPAPAAAVQPSAFSPHPSTAALPASASQRGSIEDMLGYGETKSVEQQRREARAALGGALKPDAANMQRSRWQV